jgi:hypothetical protein
MKGDKSMINMSEIISGVTLTKACSIKADKDSDESKVINLRVKFDGATLRGVFDKALSGTVIAWQNGVGRKKFDEFEDKQTVEVQFTSPATKPTEAPEDAFMREAKAAGIDVNDEAALTTYIIKRMKKA